MRFERGQALIIGVGEYIHHPHANIPQAAEDARQVHSVLADAKLCGYRPERVTLLTGQQATRAAILQGLGKLAEQAGPDDTALIFFSGHGALGTDSNYYLTACDSRFSGERVVQDSGVSEGDLLRHLRAIPVRKMALFINACYAGEIAPHFGPEEAAEVESSGLPESTADAILSSGEGRLIITSSRENQRSYGKAGQATSLFGQALVDGLRGRGWVPNNAGYVGAFGLYEYLYEAVKEAAAEISRVQEPELTVLKGVGPFPLALYKGASQPGSFDVKETISGAAAVRQVSERASRRQFDRIINTGGGAYIEGDVIIENGDFVAGDKHEHYYHAPDPAETAAKQREAARRGYLKELRATCQALPLAAMGEDESTGADITLDQIYIDLDTTAKVKVEKGEQKRSGQADPFTRPGEGERPVTALEAAAGSPRLVLLGDPGAGKSTFVRRLAAWLAAAGLGEAVPPTGIDPGLTPILVTLRDLAPRLNIPGFDALPAARRQAALLDALHEQIRAELALLGKEAPAYADGLLEDLGGGRCLLVLDGLDEVPYTLRERVRAAAAAAMRSYRVERVILTCRVRSYSGASVFADFTAFTLAPFDEDKIRAFSRAWYNTQLQLKRVAGEEQAQKRAENLASAALALRELASNPMLLTSMAIIHQRDIGLPEQRVRLYSLVVDVLARRWQKHKTGELLPSPALEAFFKDDLRLRAALERLGYEAHRASTGQEEQAGDLLRIRAIEILEAREHLGDPGLANEFLDYVDQRAGLLAGRGGELGRPVSYGFPHRSLQEYLAGCYLAGQRDLFGALYQHAGEGEGWDLAVQLGFEELYYNRRGAHTLLDLAYHICASCDTAGPQKQRALLWSGQAAALVGQEAILEDNARPDGGEGYLGRIRGKLTEVMGGELSPVERGEAGDALARLGDPRFDAEKWHLPAGPLLDFIEIPAGPFQMGTNPEKDRMARENEQPQHLVNLATFYMARFPATVAQFRAFVEKTGYQPRDPGSLRGIANHPAIKVSWHDAQAYCDWLEKTLRESDQTPAAFQTLLRAGYHVRLPTEAQWEKAARGTDGWLYPWGNDFDPNKANTFETGLGITSPVGCFPSGASPYGCQDMSGNVWEWCADWYSGKYYSASPKQNPPGPEKGNVRVLRGGSWDGSQYLARCAFRDGFVPGYGSDFGFRCVLSP